MAQEAIQLGSVLMGRYRVDRILGQGGMGVVVQAMHLQLQQPVAIKLLLPELLGEEHLVQRFLREAQAAVRLRSEHVARVIDVGTLDNGAPYMVLEFLEGADLSSYASGQLSVGDIVNLMLQACEALAEAHSLGIVHRDIKPANFFITRRADGTPLLKVLDFGISKVATVDQQLTATHAVMGTPAYMSPEQMRSTRDVDHRSDIWALGIVLWELLQGAPPFGGNTFSSMVLKVVTEPLPPLQLALPPGLDAIIYHCLEKDPARRFQNVAELAHALAPYASSSTQAAISVQRTGGITGVNPGTPATAPPGRPISTISGAAGAMSAPPAARRWPIVASFVVLVLGVGAGAYGLTRSSPGPGGEESAVGGAAPGSPSVQGASPASPPAPMPPIAPAPTPAVAPPAPAQATAAPSPAPTPPIAPPAPAETAPSSTSAVGTTPPPAAAAATPPAIAEEPADPGSPRDSSRSRKGSRGKSTRSTAKPAATPSPDDDRDILDSRN